jgi:hypothetical protein
MRNLVLILLAFIAVVTFIRAFDNPGTGDLRDLDLPPPQMIESRINN